MDILYNSTNSYPINPAPTSSQVNSFSSIEPCFEPKLSKTALKKWLKIDEHKRFLTPNNKHLDTQPSLCHFLINETAITNKAFGTFLYLCKEYSKGFSKKKFVSAVDFDGETPLHRTVTKGLFYLVAPLLKAGANINSTTKNIHDTPLHMACRKENNHLCIKILLKYSPRVTSNLQGRTPLHEAAIKGDRKIINSLLYARAPINTQDIDGRTALHLACMKGNSKTAHTLINNNAALDIKNNFGQTPLHEAAISGNKEIINALINTKVNLNAQDNNGHAALHLACIKRNFDAALALINHNALLTIKNKQGKTPLHEAAQSGYLKLVKKLFKQNKALINDMDLANDTPLTLACQTAADMFKTNHPPENSNPFATIGFLVINGASLNAKNKYGKTALKILFSPSQITTSYLGKIYNGFEHFFKGELNSLPSHLDTIDPNGKKLLQEELILILQCLVSAASPRINAHDLEKLMGKNLVQQSQVFFGITPVKFSQKTDALRFEKKCKKIVKSVTLTYKIK